MVSPLFSLQSVNKPILELLSQRATSCVVIGLLAPQISSRPERPSDACLKGPPLRTGFGITRSEMMEEDAVSSYAEDPSWIVSFRTRLFGFYSCWCGTGCGSPELKTPCFRSSGWL